MRFIEKLSPKELSLWLIGSILVLLLAIGGAYLIWTFRSTGGTVGFLNKNSTYDVKKVEFLPPDDMPKTLVAKPADFINAKSVSYTDEKSGCDLLQAVVARPPKTSTKEVAIEFVSSKYINSKNLKTEDQTELNIKDVDGERNYDFNSVFITQETTAGGIGFKNRSMLVRYRDFGRDSVAVISYACKDAAWEAKRAGLEETVTKFTLKTER